MESYGRRRRERTRRFAASAVAKAFSSQPAFSPSPGFEKLNLDEIRGFDENIGRLDGRN